MGTNATLEPRPGGLYYCEVIPGHVAKGEFVEVDRPHRIVYTWGWEQSTQEGAIAPGSTRIEIELVPDGAAPRSASATTCRPRPLPNRTRAAGTTTSSGS